MSGGVFGGNDGVEGGEETVGETIVWVVVVVRRGLAAMDTIYYIGFWSLSACGGPMYKSHSETRPMRF